ncbi:MAG TPA: glycosyltransferase [Candidatus Udaeobacter sp.]|nr:glycosyltransferase [Candidatus Udaeobacter sp.]
MPFNVMPPLVSIIIPTYNRWPLVREAIESVLAQRFRDFELIVVDDGSTDGTVGELGSFGGSLRLVRQDRKGVAAARNSGVAVARGRYIAFLDSDDLWLSKKLAIQTAFMEQNTDFEISQTEEIWLRRGVRVNRKEKHRKASGDIFRRSLDLCLVSPSAVMMTKALFERLRGFDEAFPVCEDYDLWLRIGVERGVALIPTALVVKRGGHPDQLSRSMWGMDRYRIVALQKLLQTGLRGKKRDWVIEVLKRKVGILCQGARKRGREGEAVNYEALLTELVREKLNVG